MTDGDHVGVPSISLAAVRPSPSPRGTPGRMTSGGHPGSTLGPVPDIALGSLKADSHVATQRLVSSDDLPAAAALGAHHHGGVL